MFVQIPKSPYSVINDEYMLNIDQIVEMHINAGGGLSVTTSNNDEFDIRGKIAQKILDYAQDHEMK